VVSLAQLSPLQAEARELRVEARFLIGELRWPTTSDELAIERTLENYPGLTEDEIRAWWRVGEFRHAVKEAREIAAEYAAEDLPSTTTHTEAADPYLVDAAEALSSPVGAKSSFLARWFW
jgi:hypothetical protein